MEDSIKKNDKLKESVIKEVLILLFSKKFSCKNHELNKLFEQFENDELKIIIENFWNINNLSDLKDLIAEKIYNIPYYVLNPRTIFEQLKQEGFIKGYGEILIERLENNYSLKITKELEKEILNSEWETVKKIENNLEDFNEIDDIKKILE